MVKGWTDPSQINRSQCDLLYGVFLRNLSAGTVHTMSLSSSELEALLAAPAMQAPAGITPNFDNPPNQNGLAWFVTTFCMVIATACLLVRLYSRVWQQRKLRHIEGM